MGSWTTRRLSPFVAAALALHVALFVVAHFAPARRGPQGPQAADEKTIEVWVTAPEPVSPEPDEPSPAPQDPATPAKTDPAEAVPRAARVPASSTEVLRANPITEPGAESWSMPAISTKPVDIGLDRNAFAQGLLPMPPAPSRAPAPRADAPPRFLPPASRTGGLSEGLAAHDQELGLWRAGPVVTAAHDAVSTSLVPNDSAATIEIRFDGGGYPVDVRVVTASGAESEWTDAAHAILASLKSRPVRVPEKSAGLAVHVHVEVAMKLPGGTKSVLKPSGMGLAGDLSNIGQHARRTVSARIVGERIL